jgi:DNA polymerase III gamma/tau subunit
MTQVQDLKPVIGHKKAQEVIIKLINDNKLPHAVLLHGSKGIGKAKFAEILAMMIICGNNPASAANKFSVNINSANYKRIIAGSLDEFRTIKPADGKKQITVDQVREAMGNLALASDNKRVIIIDSADELNQNSANAILKTLEEPPANTMLILISSSPAKLLPTISSRCRKIKLDNLALHEVEQILEENGFADKDLSQALEFSAGSVSKAIEFLTDGKEILNLVDDFFSKDKIYPDDVIVLADKLADKKFKEDLVYSQIRDIIYTANKKALGLSTNLDNIQAVKFLAENYDNAYLSKVYDSLLETQKMRNAINIGQPNCLENIFKNFIKYD